MSSTIDVEAPDGWICEVVDDGEGSYIPVCWKPSSISWAPEDLAQPSPGLRRYIFCSAEEAMMAAFRERLQRECLLARWN
jgi:hypothetical protein